MAIDPKKQSRLGAYPPQGQPGGDVWASGDPAVNSGPIDLSQFDPSIIEEAWRKGNPATLNGTSKGGGLGTYGEGVLNAFPAALTQLKSALDAGQISVGDYLKTSRPLIERADQLDNQIKRGGQKAAQAAASIDIPTQLGKFGYHVNTALSEDDPKRYKIDLGQKYEQSLRQELIPENIQGEERDRLLKDIPNDIGFDTDRYTAEREGVRQRLQQEQAATDEATKRKQYTGELANILNTENERQFKLDQPGILEDLNARGLLNSSGVGDALAKRRQELAGAAETQLAQANLADKESVLPLYRNAIQTQQNFQSAGIQRDFSLDDFLRQTNAAIQIGQSTMPQQPKGKSAAGQVGLAFAQGAGGAATNAAAGKAKG
jgi:hypothetical protein